MNGQLWFSTSSIYDSFNPLLLLRFIFSASHDWLAFRLISCDSWHSWGPNQLNPECSMFISQNRHILTDCLSYCSGAVRKEGIKWLSSSFAVAHISLAIVKDVSSCQLPGQHFSIVQSRCWVIASPGTPDRTQQCKWTTGNRMNSLNSPRELSWSRPRFRHLDGFMKEDCKCEKQKEKLGRIKGIPS